jgi:tight adherence protein B
VNDLVVQSGLRLSAIKISIGFAVPCFLFYVLFRFTLGSELLSLALSVLAAAGLFYCYLLLARKRRIAAFAEQLPDSLDVIVRGLRAGHPFRVALALVAREMPDPVGSEFGILADEIMFGLDQSTAVQNLCQRVGQDDLSYFSIAISIQTQTGGNLAEILARLSRLIRSRSKLRLKIRSLSSEGRLSGIALSLAPFFLFGIITLISPDYFGAVKNHPLIPPAVAVAGVLLLIGNVMMYRMVNFKF